MQIHDAPPSRALDEYDEDGENPDERPSGKDKYGRLPPVSAIEHYEDDHDQDQDHTAMESTPVNGGSTSSTSLL